MDVGTTSLDEDQKGIGIPTTDVTKSKPIPHIAPRIDAEYYQAQVLDIGTINGISSSSVAGNVLNNNFVSQLFAFGDREFFKPPKSLSRLSARSWLCWSTRCREKLVRRQSIGIDYCHKSSASNQR